MSGPPVAPANSESVRSENGTACDDRRQRAARPRREIRTLNLIYHVWPVASNELWKWNVARLLERMSVFNGKRVVAIATDEETVSADEVKRALDGYGIRFITMLNDARLREATTFLPLLDEVHTLLNRHAICGARKDMPSADLPRLHAGDRWSKEKHHARKGFHNRGSGGEDCPERDEHRSD